MEEEPEKKKPKKRWGKQAVVEEEAPAEEEGPEKSATPSSARHETGSRTAIWRPGDKEDSTYFVSIKGKWNPGSENTLVQDIDTGLIRNVLTNQLYYPERSEARLKPSHKAPTRRWGKRGAEQKAGETG